MKIPKVFSLKVFDENGLIFDKNVASVSAENDTGPLSILPGHINFISTIRGSLEDEKLIANFEDGTTKGFLLESGVIKVYENKVNIYLVLDFDITEALV